MQQFEQWLGGLPTHSYNETHKNKTKITERLFSLCTTAYTSGSIRPISPVDPPLKLDGADRPATWGGSTMGRIDRKPSRNFEGGRQCISPVIQYFIANAYNELYAYAYYW